MNLLIFYIFSTILISSAIGVVLARNAVYSVLFLILAFFCAAGIFILQGAEFLAMLLVIVYVGAVAILFLFVIMMLNIEYQNIKKNIIKILPFIIIFAAVFIIEIYLVMNSAENYVVLQDNFTTPSDITNSHAIGQVLYTDFFIHFQIAGMILLVSMIGAVVLTYHKRNQLKKQNITQQVNRTRAESVKVVKVLTGKGV